MADLYRNVGEMNYDGLITDLLPAVIVRGATVRKLATAATLKRGTILAKSGGSAGDGKLVILGTTAETNETLTPFAVLCDDIAVGTAEDVVTSVYMSGCFDLSKCTVADSYEITDVDIDALRAYGIMFKVAEAAN